MVASHLLYGKGKHGGVMLFKKNSQTLYNVYT